MKLIRSKHRILVVAIAAIAGATGAATASIGTAVAKSHRVSHGRATVATSASLAQAFPVLGASRSASDTLPNGFDLSNDGVDAGHSHAVLAAGGTQLWLVPGSSDACLVVVPAHARGTYGCTTATVAATRGIVGGIAGAAQGELWGVLPRGARGATLVAPNGATSAVQTNSDGAFSLTVAAGSKLVYTAADGTQVNVGGSAQPMPAPPNLCPANTSWCR